MRPRGFTRIETMIALVVAATAPAIILANVRALMQRAEQEQRLMRGGGQLLNDMVLVRLDQPPRPLQKLESDRVVLSADDEGKTPPINVFNFSLAGETPIPSVQLAFTPYQRFSLERDGRTLSFLAKRLIPPRNGHSVAVPP